ncbi:MAG TPA: lipase secretion chaperone [Paucimonas sp.]|nr:lipase secretion chaperone [Paucimonas sp.]
MSKTIRWALLGLTAVLLLLVANRFRSPDDPPAAPTVQASPVREPTQLGPGRFSAAAGALPAARPDTEAPGGLALTADRRLIVNKALRDVFDYFLLGGHAGERAQHVARLLAHLRDALPSPAHEEAVRIAHNYLAYLEQHDKLLARADAPRLTTDGNLPPADLDRIGAWLAERARLRQSTLGIDVARAWFGDEEIEQQRKLAELRGGARQPALEEADPVQQTMSNLSALRAQGASEQAQRNVIAERFGEAAARRFDALEREEQAWRERYAAYRREAERIRQQAGAAAEDRMRQLDGLRQQMFPAEPERMRAQALDAHADTNRIR